MIDLNVALKIKADATQAQAALKATTAQLQGVEAAARSAGGGADTYTQRMSALQRASNAAAKQSRDTAAALALMAKIDPAGDKLGKLDELESALNGLHKSGSIGAEDFARMGQILGAQRATLTGVAKDVDGVGKSALNARTQYSLFALVSDAATEQFTRGNREVAALANETGLLGKLLNPVGLTIGAAAAAVAVFAAALLKGEEETEKFNAALISTGNYAGASAGQLVQMANSVGASTGHYAETATALTSLASSGKFTRAQLQQLTQTAVEFATMTGGKVADGVKFVDAVMSGNIGTITKLDQQYHFLTATQFDEIQRLTEQGDTERATAIAQQAASQAVAERAQEVKASAGIMQRAWEDVTGAIHGMLHAMADIGATHSFADQLADAQKALAVAKQPQAVGKGEFIPVNQAQVAALQARVNDLQKKSFNESYVQTNGGKYLGEDGQEHTVTGRVNTDAETKSKQGLAALAQFKTAREVFDSATAKAKTDLDNAMLGTLTADEIARAKMHYQQALDQAQKAFDSATKQKKGPKGPDLDKLQGNAAVAAVQDSLAIIQNAYKNADAQLAALRKTDQISDKAYYDGLRADLAKYVTDRTAALGKEKAEVLAHATTQAQRIQANQKAAQIDAEITKTQQDAATKRMQIDAQEQQAIEASRKAYEALKRSFETPAEARVDEALLQINTLNKALKDGVITAEQYHTDLGMIGQHAVTSLPTYRGVGAAVGGPSGELQKNFAAQTALDTAYKTDLLALNDKFRGTDLAHQQAYDSARAKLDQDYSQKSKVIEQSRGALQLQTASDIFGELATLSSSHNKKMATIGKAAAIAQTIIKTYQSATEAYSSLASIPYIGPELGAAAAAVAIAAGLANVAAIRAQPVGAGYAQGGYTGNAPITQAVGVVHGREGVLSAPEVQALGGEVGFHALRGAIRRGYADGGFVHPLANAPTPAQLGFRAPITPRVRLPQAANDSNGRAPQVNVKNVVVFDREQLAEQLMNTAAGHKVIVHVVGDNPRTIQGKWQAG